MVVKFTKKHYNAYIMFQKIKSLLFHNTTSKQTIAKNVAWLSLSQLAGRLIRGLFIIFVARVLGATEYGIFSYALGLAGFFTLFADIGVNSILTRDASREPEKAVSYFATSFWIKTFLLAVTTILVVFVAPHFSKIASANVLLYFVALLTIFDNFREFFNSFFRAKEKMEFEALINVAMNIAISVIGAIVLYFSHTAIAVTISYVGSAGVGFIIAGFILKKELKKIISHFDKKLVAPVIKAALPIAILGFLGSFMLNIDIVIIGWFRSAAEIGFYSAGQKIVALLYTVPTILASATFPAISRLAGKGESEKVSLVMEKGMAMIFALALPLTIGGIVLAGPIISMLYGAEYLPSVLTFQIMLLTILIIFPQTLLANLILSYNKQSKLAKFVALTALGNVILDLILIPRFGIAGSAAGTVIVQAAYNFLIWNMIKKINPFQTMVHLKKIFFASVFLGILCFVFNEIDANLFVNIFVSAAAYFALLFILKENVIEDLKPILKTLRS